MKKCYELEYKITHYKNIYNENKILEVHQHKCYHWNVQQYIKGKKLFNEMPRIRKKQLDALLQDYIIID